MAKNFNSNLVKALDDEHDTEVMNT